MDTISQFGGELQELRNQLEAFEVAAKSSNDELDGLRQRTDDDAAAVTAAGAQAKKALAGLDSSFTHLRQKVSDSKNQLQTQVNTVQTQLRASSDELKASQAAAQTQLDACDARLRKGSLDLEQVEALLSASEEHTQQACQASLDTLKSEGRSTENLLTESVQQIRQKSQILAAESASLHQHWNSYRALLGGEICQDAAARFKLVANWLEQNVGQLHALAFTQCHAISQSGFDHFHTLGSALARQVANTVNQSFSTVLNGMQGSRQTISSQLSQRTGPALAALLGAQLQVAETFEPGNQAAQNCSNNFPVLKQNVEVLRKLANS
jgi:hypothetical protein